MVLMYLSCTVHCLCRPFLLTFLWFKFWFYCFGFISELRFSSFQPSPPSSLEVDDQYGSWGWLRLPRLRPISRLLVSYLPLFMSLVHWFLCLIFLQFIPLASFVPKASLIRLQFLFWDHLLKTIYSGPLISRIQLIFLFFFSNLISNY